MVDRHPLRRRGTCWPSRRRLSLPQSHGILRRQQGRSLFGEHGGDLAFGGAVNARIGPALFPAVEIGLRFLQTLEAQTLQRRFLRVANAGFDFAFAIRILNATGHGDGAVVSEYVAVERIQRGIVEVGDEYALAQIVENDHARGAAKSAESALVELGPDTSAGAERQQTNGFPAAAQGHDEQTRAAIRAGFGIAHHRSSAVVDLGFLAGRRGDHHAGFRYLRAAKLSHEALHTLVAAGETVLIDQVLPDGYSIAASAEPESMASRYGSQALALGLRWGEGGCSAKKATSSA